MVGAAGTAFDPGVGSGLAEEEGHTTVRNKIGGQYAIALPMLIVDPLIGYMSSVVTVSAHLLRILGIALGRWTSVGLGRTLLVVLLS